MTPWFSAADFRQEGSVRDRDERQIACVLVPNLHWQLAVSDDEALRDSPVVVASGRTSKPQRTVVDLSPGLTGVVAGMALDQALSRNSEAVLVEADFPAAETLNEKVLTALETAVPDVEEADLGIAYVDIGGVQLLYGDNTRVVQAISRAVSETFDLDIRIGIGPSKWLAYIAAMRSKPRTAYRLTTQAERFLKGLPVTVLPIEPKTISRMQEFGLSRLGDIGNKPRGAMHSQFGADGATAWDLANGIDQSPLVPRRTQETVSEYLEFPDSTVNLLNITTGIESLLSRAYARPLLRNRHARKCELQAQVFENAPWVMDVVFKEPAGSKSDALFAVKGKLDSTTIPGPLEDLRVTLSGLTGEQQRQESMWLEIKRQTDLSDSLSQLEQRIGEPPPIYRVQTLKPTSKVPEWRSALVQLSH